MRITKYKTVHQLTTLPHLFPVNTYLVDEPDGFTLIDTGMAFAGKKIVQAAQAACKPITRIVLTHPHSDHAGSLPYLKSVLPEALVHISERDSSLLQGDLSVRRGESSNQIKGSFPKSTNIQADVLLQDGDDVGALTVVATPGHTPGSIALYDSRSKVLIVGDAFQVKGGIAVAGDKRPAFPFPAIATWDKGLAIESAERLLQFDIEVLAVGHGNLIENPKAMMAEAVQRAKKLGGQ